MEVGRSNTGSVFLTSIADLGARIAAAEKLQDRVYGKPKQALEHSGPEGSAIDARVEIDDETREAVRELGRRRARARAK